MSDRGETPRAIVARGKIKVDAGKAIAKLRDHLLVDLHLYGREIARVAVALGASRLDITWDADDVVFTFDGRPLPAAAVVRARDHVLTPETQGADGAALRVLGLGVSAALGLGPRFVDVISADAESCTRVRFESKHIDEAGAEDVPETITIPRPPDLGTAGMRVHVRKKVRLGDLGRIARSEAPREVLLLGEVAHATRLAITTHGKPIPERPDHVVLARVDLDEPLLRRGSLEILAPAPNHRPRTTYLDLGVELTEGPPLGIREGVASQLPVRVIVDADRLPTNASRSEVRLDSDLAKRVRARVPAAFAAALTTLSDVVFRGGPLPAPGDTPALGHRVEILEPRREVLEHALGAIAAEVALLARGGAALTAEENALLTLPLLRDAVGRPLSLAAVRGGTAEHPLLVHTFPEAAPVELAWWLEGVIWACGRPAEAALAPLVLVSANQHVAQAKEGYARRQRALAHPPSRAELAPSEAYQLMQAFSVSEGPFAGLHGEVAVLTRGARRRGSKARLFVDERLLEEIALPGVALPLDMALAWPSVLLARITYEGVERNDAVKRAVLYALRVAALAIGDQLGTRDPELMRLASVAAAAAARDLGDRAPPLPRASALASALVWPTADGRLESLATFEAYASLTGALCSARAGASAAVDGRPVVDVAEASKLLEILPAGTRVVHYGHDLARGAGAATKALQGEARRFKVWVPLERPPLTGFVAVGASQLRILHLGVVRSEMPFAYVNGPVTVVIEDPSAVPDSDNGRLVWTAAGSRGYEREEDALLERVLTGCESGELERADYLDYLETAQPRIRDRLREARPDQRAALQALDNRLVSLPLQVARTALARARAAVLERPLHPSRLAAAPANASAYDVPVSGPLVARAQIASRSGTVTVSLARDGDRDRRGEVLLEGHAVCETVTTYPLDVVIDVRRDDLLESYAALSGAGKQWAEETIALAALKLLEDCAKRDGFASDLDLLRLCGALVLERVHLTGKVATILRSARWPTVQGTSAPLGTTPTLQIGTASYAPYRMAEGKPSPLDAPTVHVPAGHLGAARRRLFEAVGYKLVDVTTEIARLQATRARGAASPPPQLPGQPAHPALRASLAELGATRAEGELEIHEEPRVAAARVDDSGAATPYALSVTQPVRVVFRVDEAGAAALDAEIAAATARLLRSLAPHIEQLPPFVRGRLRALLCEAASLGELEPRDDTANVFEDLRGYTWSLARLGEASARRRTSDPPPWPVDLGGHEAAALLHLSDAEANALRKVVTFEDVTKELRQRRSGEQRRAAPPVPALALPADLRADCIFTFPLEEDDGMRGEVGLLRPAHLGKRAIAVYTTMRHVRNIEDRDGWPSVAMIDVDDLETTPAFDDVAKRSDLERIQRRVRISASARAAALLETPLNTLGVVRLPVPFLVKRRTAGNAEPPIPCLGVFWMERTWPDSPSIHLEWHGGVDPFRIPRVPLRSGRHHRVLPITGQLFVGTDAANLELVLAEVFALVLERLSPILAAATSAQRASPEEIMAYVWDLRLLGARTDIDPVAEMATDRPDPVLMRVASRRAPALIDRATGDAEAAPLVPSPFPVAAATPEAEPAPDLAEHVAELPSEAEAPDFFGGLVRRIVDLVRPKPLDRPETPLTRSLLARLVGLRLTGEPVEWVVETDRGRPVRYDAKQKTIFVNVHHDAVRALATPPARIVLLLLAAVSEINRELVPVTDAEELAVLVDLLRNGESERTGGRGPGTGDR